MSECEGQVSMLEPRLMPSQEEVMEALRYITHAADTTDIQKALAEHNIPRERSNLAKRLCELEDLGLVERVGRNVHRTGHPTTWRRR